MRKKGNDGAKASSRGTEHVRCLSRALSLLNMLSEHDRGLSLSEVAHKVGLSTSTAHRLLTTLQNERYVRFDADHSVWSVGVQAFRTGSAFLQSRDLVATSRPYMKRLTEQCGETVNLAAIEGGKVICLAQTEMRKKVRVIAADGREEVFPSGVGKTLLAFMGRSDAAQLLDGIDSRRETADAPTNVRDPHDDLDIVRNRGFAVDDEENTEGLRCVAAAIFDENSAPMAGLSVSGPTARITDVRIPSLGAAVSRTADEITDAIGGQALARKHA